MKRYLSFFPEIHRTFRRGSSYSTLSACVALLVFALLAIHCTPSRQEQYPVPETAMQGCRDPSATAYLKVRLSVCRNSLILEMLSKNLYLQAVIRARRFLRKDTWDSFQHAACRLRRDRLMS